MDETMDSDGLARLRCDRIRGLREDRDLKQKDLAKYLNCSQVSYSYYEIGRRDVPTLALIKLSRFYECSVDYLLGLTDVREPYPRKEAYRKKFAEYHKRAAKNLGKKGD